jgi:hypothetical protein
LPLYSKNKDRQKLQGSSGTAADPLGVLASSSPREPEKPAKNDPVKEFIYCMIKTP